MGQLNSDRLKAIRKKKEEEAKTSSSSAGLSNSGRVKQIRMKNSVGFDTFDTDLKAASDTVQNIYSGWQTPETMKAGRNTVESMQKRINDYKSYANTYGGVTDLDTFNREMDSLNSSYQAVLDNWDSITNTYGSFENADAFNNALQKAQFKEDFGGLSYGEVQKKKEEYTPGSAEYNFLNEYGVNVGYSDLMDYEAELEALTDDSIYKDQLEEERNKYALDNAFDKYKHYMDAEDFEELSVYNPEVPDNFFEKAKKVLNGGSTYDYINDENVRASMSAKEAVKRGNAQGYSMTKQDEKGYNNLTEDEKAVYNYLVAKKGEKAGQAFLDDMEITLTKRTYDKSTKKLEQIVDENAFNAAALSAVSVPANIVGAAFSTVDSLEDKLQGKEYNPYSYGKTFSNFSTDTRRFVGENIEESTEGMDMFGQNVPSFLYQTAMSMGDSTAAALLGGPIGSAALGSSAASQRAKELKEAGADENTILAGSLASGTFEMLFEKVSLDKLLSNKGADSLGKAIWETLKQAGVEGSEEIFTETANLATDALLRGQNSDALKRYNSYLERGFSEKEAGIMVAEEELGQILWAGVGGALSGGTMGSAVTGANWHGNARTGKDLRNKGLAEDVLETASMSPEESEAYKLYAKATKKNQPADKVSNSRIGNMYNTMKAEAYSDIVTQSHNNKVNATARRLAELGYKGSDIMDVAEAVIADNKTAKQRQLIKQSGIAQDVALEIKNQAEWSTEKTSEALTKLQNRNYRLNKINSGESVRDEKITARAEEIREKTPNISPNKALLEAHAETMNEAKKGTFLEQSEGVTDVDAYAASFNLVYEYGRTGYDVDTALENRGVLTPTQTAAIYKAGIKHKVAERQQNIDNIVSKYATDNNIVAGTFDDSVIDYNNKGNGVNWNSLTNAQRGSIALAQALSKATGINITLIKSNVNSKGKYEGAAGSYNPNTNTIELDIYSGRINAGDLESAMISTLSHETTHWMKDKAPSLYQELTDIVMESLASSLDYTADGKLNRTNLIHREMDRIQKAHPDIRVTEEYAIDELVARACEDMLSNSKVARELLEQLPENERKTLYEKFKEAIENLKQWISELLGQYSAKSTEAQILREYEEKIKALQDTWNKAFKAAVTANQALQKEGNIQKEVNYSDRVVNWTLKPYSDKQLANWKDSKRIIIYENDTQLLEFVNKAISDGTYAKKMYFGKISDALANEIKNRFGYDVHDFNCTISGNEIRKILKDHGSEEYERDRGQRAVVKDDFTKIPFVMSKPTNILDGGEYRNKPCLNFKRGEYTVTGVISDKHLDLFVQTMYISNKKRSLATVTDEQASVDTSETASGTASNKTLLQKSSNVKSKKDIRQYTYGGRDAFNVDTESFTNALIMRNQGVSEEEVFEKTGWFLGTDKKWRFEIDDSEAEIFYRGDAKLADNPLYKEYMELFDEIFNWGEYDKNKVERYRELDKIFKEVKKNRTVEDYMKHDMLFDAYPFLRYIGVERAKMQDEYLGAYKPSENVIEVNQKRFKENGSIMLKKILLHELQHVVQHFERFASGANSGTWSNVEIQKNQWKYEKAMEKKDAVFAAGTDEFKSLIRKLNQLQIAKDFGEEYDKIEHKLHEKFEEQYLEYDNALFEARLYRDSESLSDVLKYQMTAGEIEARDVENRSSLNVEERRKRFPTRKTENGVIFSENKENPFEYKEMSYQDRFDDEFFELFAEGNTMEKESEVLGDDLVRLADVIRMTGKKVYSDKLVAKVARYLCTEYSSDYNKETLAGEIAKVYEYIAGTEDLQWNDVMNVCYELAGRVLKEQHGKKVTNDYAKMILKDIRNTTIRLDKVQEEEAKSAYGSNYRFILGSRIKIDPNGLALSRQWQQWSEQYPDIFDANITGGDQITALVDLYSDLKEASETVQYFNDSNTQRQLALEIYNKFWTLQTESIQDKYEMDIKQLKAEHRKAMSDLKLENAYAERWYDAEAKAKYGELVKEIRARKDEEIRNIKWKSQNRMNEYKIRVEKKTVLDRIVKNAMQLNKRFVTNSKNSNIPEVMKPAVAHLLNAIDFSSKQLLGMYNTPKAFTPTKKDISLSKALEAVCKEASKSKNAEMTMEGVESTYDGFVNFPPTFISDLEKLVEDANDIMRTVGDNQYILNEMNLEQLESLDKVVTVIKHICSEINTLHSTRNKVKMNAAAQESIQYMEKMGERNTFGEQVKGFFTWTNLTPINAFKRFGPGGEVIFEALQDAQDKMAFLAQEIMEYADKTYNAKEAVDWAKEVLEFDVLERTTLEYKTVRMPVTHAMSLYCLSKREQGLKHILGGGVRIEDFKKGGEKISQVDGFTLGEPELKAICNALTDKQRNVADRLQEFLNIVCAKWGNETSMMLYGIKGYTEKNYFPIRSDKNGLNSDGIPDTANSIYKLLNMSFTKQLNLEAKNTIMVRNIFDVFAEHTSGMAAYHSFGPAVLDACRWYNYKEKIKAEGENATQHKDKSVKGLMETAYGTEAKKYVEKFLRDINGDTENLSGMDRLAKYMMGNYKKAAVGANIRVNILQPTAYVRAAAVMDPKYLLQGLKPNQGIEKAKKHCGIALWKSMGYYDINISRGLKSKIKHDETKVDEIVEKSLELAGKMDEWTWGCLWNACEAEIKDKRPDLKPDSEDYWKAVSDRLREIIYKTQVVDSVMTRTQSMRDKSAMAQTMTAFMSEPLTSYNMVLDAAWDAMAEKRTTGNVSKQACNKIARATFAYIVSAGATAIAGAVPDAVRDDDEDKNLGEAYIEALLENFINDLNPLSKLPVLKDIVSIKQGFQPSRMDEQVYLSAVYALNEWKKIMEGKGSIYKTVYRTAQTFSQATGIPASNLFRDAVAVWNNTIGEIFPSLKIK